MTFQIRYVYCYFALVCAIIVVHHGVVAQQVYPDDKIKVNVSSIYNSMDQIKQLQPKRFEYNTHKFKNLNLPTGKYYGFMAEEFGQVFPHLVTKQVRLIPVGKNNQQTAYIKEIELQKLVPVLVSAIQEQQAMIEELKQEVENLKSAQAR